MSMSINRENPAKENSHLTPSLSSAASAVATEPAADDDGVLDASVAVRTARSYKYP